MNCLIAKQYAIYTYCREYCTNKEDGIILLELVAMAANAISAMLILAISACNKVSAAPNLRKSLRLRTV